MSKNQQSVDTSLFAVLERASQRMKDGPGWRRTIQAQNEATDRYLAARRDGVQTPRGADER